MVSLALIIPSKFPSFKNNPSNLQSSNMVICFCGQPAVVKTSWTSANPGRRFYSCPDGVSDCSFIGWIDRVMYQRAKAIIPRLLKGKNKLEAKIKEKDAAIGRLKLYKWSTWILILVYLLF